MTCAADVQTALQKTTDVFGRLDFAFNNAGVEPKKLAPIADVDKEEWDRIMGIDLRGVFLCMKYEVPLMLAHGGGAIVNTSSDAGVIGIKKNAAYTAAKHGIIGLTRATALEYAARNVRINAVCPGYIDTPMIERFAGRSEDARANVIAQEPIGRMGTPEEIAATVVWMCSDAAGFMVGHALVVDGASVVVAAGRAARIGTLVAEISNAGRKALAVATDVTKLEDVRQGGAPCTKACAKKPKPTTSAPPSSRPARSRRSAGRPRRSSSASTHRERASRGVHVVAWVMIPPVAGGPTIVRIVVAVSAA